MTETDTRATLTADDRKNLDDSDFAYVDKAGDRHLPIHDAAHAKAALGRFGQQQFDSEDDKPGAAKKIVSAAKGFGIEVDPTSDVGQAAGMKAPEAKGEDESNWEHRADMADTKDCPTCDGKGTIMEGNRDCPDCDGKGKVPMDFETKSAKLPSRSRRPLQHARRTLDRLPEMRHTTKFERRVQQDGDDVILTGMPIVYDTGYKVRDFMGSFRETMHPGVASEVMKASDFDCRFLVNHEGLPYARTTAGTLTLTDTPQGVRSDVHLDARQQTAYDLACSIERGDTSQMSIGFVVADGGDEWKWGDDGIEERDVFSLGELFDVSAVTYPASPSTSIEIAQRMIARSGAESQERVRRLFELGGAIRSGRTLTPKDGEDLRATAEALFKASEGMAPIEVQVGLYRSLTATMERALRVGKVLSAENQGMLQDALDALHSADDVDIPGITAQLEAVDKALDAGQAGLSAALGKMNPDGDAGDKNPTLVPAGSPGSDADARSRQRQRLALTKSRLALAG